MRAPYDTTFDCYYGPNGGVYGPPGTLNQFNQPCRYVPYDQIIWLTGIGSIESAWLTSDNGGINPPILTLPGPQQVLTDYSTGDQIAIPSGVAPNYFICDIEYVSPPDAVAYYRYRIAPLPYPF